MRVTSHIFNCSKVNDIILSFASWFAVEGKQPVLTAHQKILVLAAHEEVNVFFVSVIPHEQRDDSSRQKSMLSALRVN